MTVDCTEYEHSRDIQEAPSICHIFLLLSSLVRRPTGKPKWKLLCQDWQSISEGSSECALSFPGLPPIFTPSCTESWQLNLLRPLQPGRNGIEISPRHPLLETKFRGAVAQLSPACCARARRREREVLQQADVNFVRYDTGALSKTA